jgi:hypothetical protein
MLQLHSGDIQGLVVMRSGQYEGSGLFGYMDGGAELYKEYGFEHLMVQEVKIDEQVFRVEIFRMHDSLRAFGIFSISRAQCPGDDSTARYWCRVSGQVQCATGPFFLRIQSLTTGFESRGREVQLARQLLSQRQDPRVSIPWFSDGKETLGWERKAMVLFGPLGVQNGIPAWGELLDGDGYSSITILPWLLDGQPVTIGWIACPSMQAADILAHNARRHERSAWRFVRQDEGTSFLVIDADLPPLTLAGFAEKLHPSHQHTH